MYGGALLLILGWALLSSPLVLLPLGLAAVFLGANRRRGGELCVLRRDGGVVSMRAARSRV